MIGMTAATTTVTGAMMTAAMIAAMMIATADTTTATAVTMTVGTIAITTEMTGIVAMTIATGEMIVTIAACRPLSKRKIVRRN